MSFSGQVIYRGLNYQAKSAFLLFLWKLQDPSFESVTLEDEKWEDFTLNFRSGKRIICESKNYSEPIGVPMLKKVLNKIASREPGLGESDEILMICPHVQDSFFKQLQQIKVFPKGKPIPFDSPYSPEQIELIKRTEFQIFSDEDFLDTELMAYFPAHLGYWLPEEEVETLLHKVLVEQIYEKSAVGATFTRLDLSTDFSKYIGRKVKHNPEYDVEKDEIRKLFRAVLDRVEHREHQLLRNEITFITARPSLMFIVLETIFDSPNLKLEEWDYLFKPLLTRQYAFGLMHQFGKAIADESNAKYMVNLLQEQMSISHHSLEIVYIRDSGLHLIQTILGLHPTLCGEVLSFITVFLEKRQRAYFVFETMDDFQMEKETVASILERLFSEMRAVGATQKTIVNLIWSHFNLVEDDGDHSLFTPRDIFRIVAQYIDADFLPNFHEVVSRLSKQFEESRFYNGDFSGWEHYGGMTSQVGGQFTLADRHFIGQVIQP